MNPRLPKFVLPLLAAPLCAQAPGYLFATSQTETTMSGSGGTVLQTLQPNEVVAVEFAPCPVISAEKWSPVSCYNTMAGDDDNNGVYWNPAMFGTIDALCEVLSPIACSTARSVFWSPSVAMGTNISTPVQLRPGDTGRIIRNGTVDGQVEYFLRAEDLQIALGMPPTPVLVDVDAIAADLSIGVAFSVDQSHLVNVPCSAITQIDDGDIWLIPATAIIWTFDGRVQSVAPGSAIRLYDEAQVDAMVANALITDRFGNCITQVIDVEALDFDFALPSGFAFPCPGTVTVAPGLVFGGESMTGLGLCDTGNNGQIHVAGCGPLGSTCATAQPTLGIQMGVLPPNASLGVPSYVGALTSAWISRFVLEPQQHVVTTPTTITVDLWVPNTFSVVFAKVVVPTVAPSATLFPNCFFPDIYFLPWDWSSPFTGAGWQTMTTPVVTFPNLKAVFQAATILSNGQIVLSTPASVDIN